MKIEFVPSDAEVGKTGVIAVLAFEKAALAGAAAELDRQTGGALARAIAGGRFTGAQGQSLDLIAPHGIEAARVLIVGAGAEGKFDERALELAAAPAYQAVKMSGAESLTLRLPGVGPRHGRSCRPGRAARRLSVRQIPHQGKGRQETLDHQGADRGR